MRDELKKAVTNAVVNSVRAASWPHIDWLFGTETRVATLNNDGVLISIKGANGLRHFRVQVTEELE